VSQLGLVFVNKTEAKTKKIARGLALDLIKTWNDYLSGNIYGFMIEDELGNEKGGCWGYYGDFEESGLLDNAKADVKQDKKEMSKLWEIAQMVT